MIILPPFIPNNDRPPSRSGLIWTFVILGLVLLMLFGVYVLRAGAGDLPTAEEVRALLNRQSR